jgi:hypothetical protein
MSSYLYYIEDTSMFADHEYDRLCKFFYDNFDVVVHRHKYLVDKENLRAGTGFTIKREEYPQMVIGAALQYVKERGLV